MGNWELLEAWGFVDFAFSLSKKTVTSEFGAEEWQDLINVLKH